MLSCSQDEPTSNLTDCVLKHLVVSREYDIFTSNSHPRRAMSSECGRSTSHDHVSPSSSPAQRRCRRRWYLGVNRHGRVRTIKTARRPPPMKTFFYKSWYTKKERQTHNPFSIRPSIAHPFAPTTTPLPSATAVASGRRGRKKGRRRLSRPAFPLTVYGRRRNGSRPTTVVSGRNETVAAAGVQDTRCGSNLLSSCGRRRNTIEDRSRPAAFARRRPVSRREGRRRSILMRSP